MDKRVLKISFVKAGAGNITPRMILPKKWIDILKITPENREVEASLDLEKWEIIIRKATK